MFSGAYLSVCTKKLHNVCYKIVSFFFDIFFKFSKNQLCLALLETPPYATFMYLMTLVVFVVKFFNFRLALTVQ